MMELICSHGKKLEEMSQLELQEGVKNGTIFENLIPSSGGTMADSSSVSTTFSTATISPTTAVETASLDIRESTNATNYGVVVDTVDLEIPTDGLMVMSPPVAPEAAHIRRQTGSIDIAGLDGDDVDAIPIPEPA
jgi:hypothetical protein